MSLAYSPERLRLPDTLRSQLSEYRRRVWTIKMAEGAAAAACGILLAYLLMFGFDRIWESPRWLRLSLFGFAALASANVPWMFYRWIWNHRGLEPLARLLSRKHPRIGDRLLGVIELVRSDFEQARSPALCAAAIKEVAHDLHRHDFRDAVPSPRHWLWLGIGAVPLAATIALFLLFPTAAANALKRFALPWQDDPRYTFTMLDPAPNAMIVPHGEPFSITFALADRSAWRPDRGVAQLGAQRPVSASLENGRYQFELPPQIDPGTVDVAIGDAVRHVRIKPVLRPEITSIVASVGLPAYLGRPQPQVKDARGGGTVFDLWQRGGVHGPCQPRSFSRRNLMANRSCRAEPICIVRRRKSTGRGRSSFAGRTSTGWAASRRSVSS